MASLKLSLHGDDGHAKFLAADYQRWTDGTERAPLSFASVQPTFLELGLIFAVADDGSLLRVGEGIVMWVNAGGSKCGVAGQITLAP